MKDTGYLANKAPNDVPAFLQRCKNMKLLFVNLICKSKISILSILKGDYF